MIKQICGVVTLLLFTNPTRYIMKSYLLLTLGLCSAAFADKVVLKEQAFSIRQTLGATVLPNQAMALSLNAEEWGAFTILEILPHGTMVKKDQVLIQFDRVGYDKKLRDAESARNASRLTLANSEAEFITAEKFLPMQLQSSRIKAEESAEAWAYFQSTRRDSKIKEANLALRQAEMRLDSEREELVQLEKMYKADDLTENTEEIILKRQVESVKAAELGLEFAQLNHKRTMELMIPREAVSLEREAQTAAVQYAEHQQSLPRAFELRRIALEDARVVAKRADENYEKLVKETDLFTLKAPADGCFYYGNIEDGRWATGEAIKGLMVQGVIGAKRPFATLIPTTSPMVLEAFVDEAAYRQLKNDIAGYATCTGRSDVSFPVKLDQLATVPGTDGRYRVTLSAQFAGDLAVVPGMTASANLSAYHKDAAIVVALKALHATNDGGWEVEVEEAEGKTKKVAVQRGLTSGDNVEILSGLTKEQTIIVPGA